MSGHGDCGVRPRRPDLAGDVHGGSAQQRDDEALARELGDGVDRLDDLEDRLLAWTLLGLLLVEERVPV